MKKVIVITLTVLLCCFALSFCVVYFNGTGRISGSGANVSNSNENDFITVDSSNFYATDSSSVEEDNYSVLCVFSSSGSEDENWGHPIPSVTISFSSIDDFELPEAPNVEGYLFDGWYFDRDGSDEFNTSDFENLLEINSFLRLYALYDEII